MTTKTNLPGLPQGRGEGGGGVNQDQLDHITQRIVGNMIGSAPQPQQRVRANPWGESFDVQQREPAFPYTTHEYPTDWPDPVCKSQRVSLLVRTTSFVCNWARAHVRALRQGCHRGGRQ